jgi:hypothetical protein
MNLFRSKEHARNWPEFEPATEEGIISLQDGASLMSTPRHSERLSSHYVSSAAEAAPAFFEKLRQVTNNSQFWAPPTE